MNEKHIKRIRRNLTLHFALLAWLTTMLIASGSDSSFLPALIFFVSLVGFFVVDVLELGGLGRIGSYVGMTSATCIAIGGYIYSLTVGKSESGQLLAVAGLLVYPECVLFLQRKNLRVFEQLAIFLLLEIIVAALINDNLLFGVLLTPIMLLWVSSLFLFSRYATLVQLQPSIDTPVPLLAELIYQSFVKPMFAERPKRAAVTANFVASTSVQSSNLVRRSLQTLPIGVGAILFAAFFFYALPRTTHGKFRPSVNPRTGIPDEMLMGAYGTLLQDPTPVMRVSFTSWKTRKPYQLSEPPYLRAKIFDKYVGKTWREIAYYPRFVALDAVENSSASKHDLTVLDFDVLKDFADTLFSVPPPLQCNSRTELNFEYDPFRQLLRPLDQVHPKFGRSLNYQIASSGFARNRQLPIVPALFEVGVANRYKQSILQPVFDFQNVEVYRQEILATAGCDETKLYEAAKCYENHFIYSGEYSYSLDLRPPSDRSMDPVEDFILNQRQGHCQYFAAAMVAMLRQNNIPSRIVGGYRPTEFNKFGYFSVRQSDAHAWVEALFTREQLQNTELAKWLSPEADDYWVRFDATPGSDGGAAEIVEASGQTLDYANKLWKDYVVEAQRVASATKLYGESRDDEQNIYSEGFARALEALRNGQFLPGENNFGFLWPVAVVALILVGLALSIWRLIELLPRWAPNLARRLGMQHSSQARVKEVFFARCLRLLEQRGFHRSKSQTPQELTTQAGHALANVEEGADLSSRLRILTQLYYRLRFSDNRLLSDHEEAEIATALKKLESIPRPSKASL
jgi:protein-glutamine gamma-glutamyltransferase